MKPLLTYFAIRGRAEPVRVMLIDLGIEFDERRVTMEEWPTVKPTLAFRRAHVSGRRAIHQSKSRDLSAPCAQAQSLRRQRGGRVRCDIVEEAFVDAQNNIGGFCWSPNFADLRADYEATKLPPLLERLQQLLDLNPSGSGWWVGNRVSYADYLAWHTMEYVRALSPHNLNRFERLKAAKLKLKSPPRIAEYLRSHDVRRR